MPGEVVLVAASSVRACASCAITENWIFGFIAGVVVGVVITMVGYRPDTAPATGKPDEPGQDGR